MCVKVLEEDCERDFHIVDNTQYNLIEAFSFNYKQSLSP